MQDIVKLNPISSKVNEILTQDKYNICDNSVNPIAILVRSFVMHEYPVQDSVVAVARAGAGVNNIPIPQMTEKGICVFNTPGANANAVKELVICGLLLGSRKIFNAINWVQGLEKNDELPKAVEKGKKAFIGPEIFGKTLGIVGLGAIGRLVADAAIALGMRIVGYDPFLSDALKSQLNPNIKVVTTLDEVYKDADYITLHVPATNDTKGFINKDTIAKMKDGVVIINCARGELFNDQDVLDAVNSGKVARVITDLPNKNLTGNDNIVTFPHLGASTPEAEDNCAVMAANELKEFIENGNVINSVNFPCVKAPKIGERVTVLANTQNAVEEASSIVGANTTILGTNSAVRGDLTYIIFDLDKKIDDNTLKTLNDKFVKARLI
ncbi:MAG: 3-phosphoglycerate dehydrogenase [Clostridia bacterium]|nr:3-phosphoglycerate dehydrogenase [Clostridia bacterium]